MKTNNKEEEIIILKVTGIGGIFFITEDTEKAKQWYADNLGLNTDQWGASFISRNFHKPEEINYLQWSTFKRGDTFFKPSKKDFMINYRVQNIEGLVKKLKNNKVTILDEMETFDYGKFIHIMDADGNKIELWEPIDKILTNAEEEITK